MKEAFFQMVKFTLIIAVIILIIVGLPLIEKKYDKEAYNDGICTECEGNYVFSGATHIKNSGDDYYYTCDKCGHTIKTHSLMK